MKPHDTTSPHPGPVVSATPERRAGMTLRRLRWLSLGAALGFIVLLELVRELIFPYLIRWEGRFLMDLVILTGALFFLGVVFQIFQRLQERLERQNQELLRLHIAEERLRIAHEMHDGLAQVLAYVNTKAQVVKEHLRHGRGDEASRHLDQLAAAAREIYTDVRESIIGLRTAASDRPLADSLREYVTAWSHQHSLECTVAIQEEPRLSAHAELQLLRILQEALANVRKHAHAQSVAVCLGRDGEAWTLTIQDDGVGFNPGELGRSELPRFGLATMRERAESIGGTVALESSPGQGTRILVALPFQNLKT